jgi:hypothetical protein
MRNFEHGKCAALFGQLSVLCSCVSKSSQGAKSNVAGSFEKFFEMAGTLSVASATVDTV